MKFQIAVIFPRPPSLSTRRDSPTELGRQQFPPSDRLLVVKALKEFLQPTAVAERTRVAGCQQFTTGAPQLLLRLRLTGLLLLPFILPSRFERLFPLLLSA